MQEVVLQNVTEVQISPHTSLKRRALESQWNERYEIRRDGLMRYPQHWMVHVALSRMFARCV